MTGRLKLPFLGEKNLKVEKLLFNSAWILMVIHTCIANSNASIFSNSIVSYIACLLFILKIVYTNDYEIKEIFLMALMCIIGVISFKESKSMSVFWFALTISSTKNIDIIDLIKKTLVTTILCCVSFYILYLFKIIPGDITTNSHGDLRYGLGLGHPNMFSAYYAIILVMFLYLYYEKINIYYYVFFVIGEIIVYSITKSRTGLILTFFILAMFIILTYISDKHKRIYVVILIVSAIVGIMIFTILPIVYKSDNNIYESLNKVLTGRLGQGNYYYNKYGISLFGKYLEELTMDYKIAYLDNGYMKMLINNGLIYYCMVIFGYIYIMIQSMKVKNDKLVLVCITIIVYMATENVATYIFANICMLAFSKLIFNNQKSYKCEE